MTAQVTPTFYTVEPLHGLWQILVPTPGAVNDLERLHTDLWLNFPTVQDAPNDVDTVPEIVAWLRTIRLTSPKDKLVCESSRTNLQRIALAAAMQLRVPVSPLALLTAAITAGVSVVFCGDKLHLAIWKSDPHLRCFNGLAWYCEHALQDKPWPPGASLTCEKSCPAGIWTVEQNRPN